MTYNKPETTNLHGSLLRSGLKKIAQSTDFKICIPDYTQTPDIYLDKITGFARNHSYLKQDTLSNIPLDEFLGYIGANIPTTYFFIPISNKYFQEAKNEILIVDRLMTIQHKDVIIYTDDDGEMKISSVQFKVGLLILNHSGKIYNPEEFMRTQHWGVVAGVVLL